MEYQGHDLSSKESHLINQSQRALADGKKKDPIETLRLLCFSRGLTGILQLGRIFRKMDTDGNRELSFDEFTAGIRGLGLKCSKEETDEMIKSFDANGDGVIKVDEFLEKLRPPQQKSRLGIINQAFDKIDTSGTGVISLADLKRVYSVKEHPLYKSGDATEADLWKQFISHFEESPDGECQYITKEEFVNFYTSLSAAIENRAYFDLLMRQTYRI